jgi:predicted HicB family RNase H-like nuclease
MTTIEKSVEVKEMVSELFRGASDWVTFYRETLGVRGLVRQMFPSREAFAEFEKTEAHAEILRMLAKLRRRNAPESETEEPTRVITVRLPKSLHESLRAEAFSRETSVNKLCISKLLQVIDGEQVPKD